MLDPARLKRAEVLFQELVELPADRRVPALAEKCPADEELRAFVRRLLRHDDSGMGGFLRRPAAECLAATVAADDSGLPRRIGQFTVFDRVGEGGMGVVYRAE